MAANLDLGAEGEFPAAAAGHLDDREKAANLDQDVPAGSVTHDLDDPDDRWADWAILPKKAANLDPAAVVDPAILDQDVPVDPASLGLAVLAGSAIRDQDAHRKEGLDPDERRGFAEATSRQRASRIRSLL